MPLFKDSMRSAWWRRFWRDLVHRPRDYVFFWR